MVSIRLASLVLKSRHLALNQCKSYSIIQPKIISSSFSLRSYSSKISEDSNQVQVYYGTLTPRMKAVKIFSLTTSITGLFAQPILLEQGTKLGGTGMAIFLCTFAGFFTFVTPLLLHIITKSYVTELYYNKSTDEYTANTISLLLTKVQTKFKASDVKVPEIAGMFTSIVVGKTSLFLDPSQFTDTDHYAKLMGYDKPIDFGLAVKDSGKENKSDATKTST